MDGLPTGGRVSRAMTRGYSTVVGFLPYVGHIARCGCGIFAMSNSFPLNLKNCGMPDDAAGSRLFTTGCSGAQDSDMPDAATYRRKYAAIV
jgi:hypothetical protein